MHKINLILPIAMLGLTVAPALAETWTIDGKHSQANFKVRHMMVSNVNGTISGIKGAAEYDGKNIAGLKVNADMDINTISTNEAGRDKHLRGADFFDTEKFPNMSFKSKRVVKGSKGKFKLIGDLTMHGVTKEVALAVEGPTPVIKDSKGQERFGASATANINRKDFGLAYNSVLEAGGVSIGDKVQITLDIELTKDGKKPSPEKAPK